MICELGRSTEFFAKKYTKTSRKGQGLVNDSMEVGLVDSTLRTGKPFTSTAVVLRTMEAEGKRPAVVRQFERK